LAINPLLLMLNIISRITASSPLNTDMAISSAITSGRSFRARSINSLPSYGTHKVEMTFQKDRQAKPLDVMA
jgi:hypothetical protein